MSSELVAIELQLKGYDGVMSDMRALDQMLNGFRGKKNRVTIESNLAEAKKDVIAYRSEVDRLKSELKNVNKWLGDGNGNLIKNGKWDKLNDELKEAESNLKNAKQRVVELQYALRNLTQMSFGQVFGKISSAVAHMGSAMQSAGNALTRLTSPFRRFTSGIIMGAGYKALNKFTEGFDSAFSRADTMRKYPRVMQSFGYTADEAQKSINKLDASVQGLPTALDDIVNMSQRFTMTVGDLTKGTDLAIAANNAFLASMSTETQQYQGMMQLQDVLGGKKMNAREWYSLANSMMPAIRMMGESLGYTGQELDDYVSKVQQGKIANKEFIDTLIKAGADENGKIRQVAMEAMDTWEAFFSRIRTASSRFGYGIIESLNAIVETATNGKFKSVNMLLDKHIIGGIDKMTESVKGWIKAHPKEIVDFFDSIKSINWGSLISGFGEGLLQVSTLVKHMADLFGGKDLSLIGRWMVKGNILGNALTIFGGLLKGSRHIFAGIGASIFSLGKTILNIKRFGGLAGWIGTLMVGDNPQKAEETITTVAKNSSKMGKFSLGLSNFFKGWAEVVTMIGGSAFVAWGSMKLIKGTVKSFKETIEVLNDVDWDMGKKVLLGIGGFYAGMATLSGVAGHFASESGTVLLGELVVGLFATLATGFAKVNMSLIKSTLKDFSDSIGYVNTSLEQLRGLKSFGNVGVAKRRIREAVGVLNAISEELQPERNTPLGEGKGKVKALSSTVTNSLSNLATSVTAIKDSVKTLNELAGMRLNMNGIRNNTIPQLESALSSIGGMFERLPSGMGTSGTAESVANLSSIMANFKSAVNALIGKDGILNQMPKVTEKIKAMTADPELNQLDNFTLQMSKLGNALTEAYKGLSGSLRGNGDLLTRVQNFADAVYQARRIIYHLGKFNGEYSADTTSGIGKIGTVIDNLTTAFSQDKINALKQTIQTFVDSIKEALKSFDDFGAEPVEVDIQFKLSKGFYSSKKKVIKSIQDAKKDIKAQKTGISLTIPVSVTFSVSTNLGAALGRIRQGMSALANAGRGQHPITPHISTGGMATRQGVLYRSGGGSIFKPRGTDKIPAMLTEGEYVQRKQATDFWGIDFMRKVNAMDVRGAMQAMMTRMGNSTNIGRQSIFNNTVNNNQRITQNISTNNPNFAGARMSRFVGAL